MSKIQIALFSYLQLGGERTSHAGIDSGAGEGETSPRGQGVRRWPNFCAKDGHVAWSSPPGASTSSPNPPWAEPRMLPSGFSPPSSPWTRHLLPSSVTSR